MRVFQSPRLPRILTAGAEHTEQRVVQCCSNTCGLSVHIAACIRLPDTSASYLPAEMFSNGYVGTAQDSQRIRRQEKQREEQRKKFEEQQQQQREKVLNAGIKQFGASKSEALDAAFKIETVGLVTREEFMQKRNTIQQRLEQEEAREKQAAEAAAVAEKERRKKEKAKAKMKAKLSFLGDVSVE